MSNTAVKDRRRRQREDNDGDDGGRRPAQRPRSSSAPHLPSCVIGLAYRNRKHRFFIPSKENTFCGLRYQFVMVDSGCNSLLLPFPQKETEGGGFEIDMDALDPFLGDEFRWMISPSGGTGTAVGSKVLRIERRSDSAIGEMQLAFARSMELTFLRFHLGSSAADALKDHEKLLPAHREALQELLAHRGGKSETMYFLGQYHLDQVACIQHGAAMFMIDKENSDPIRIPRLAEQCDLFASPLVKGFDSFGDLEDEDHDGDDNEDRRWSWDPRDYIDETD